MTWEINNWRVEENSGMDYQWIEKQMQKVAVKLSIWMLSAKSHIHGIIILIINDVDDNNKSG